MITLGIDSSAGMVSAALTDGTTLLGEYFAQGKQNHSAALLPMIDALLHSCGLDITQVERFAVTHGPGSFTGVRIGVATVKGLAQANERPCAGVSTLAAMAAGAGAALPEGIFCCAMDARRAQAYAAIFACREGQITRLCEDEALPIAQLEQRLASYAGPVWFLGDGAALCHTAMAPRAQWQLAPQQLRYQRGYGAILAAGEADYRPAQALRALYLRPSQAERERSERNL